MTDIPSVGEPMGPEFEGRLESKRLTSKRKFSETLGKTLESSVLAAKALDAVSELPHTTQGRMTYALLQSKALGDCRA